MNEHDDTYVVVEREPTLDGDNTFT